MKAILATIFLGLFGAALAFLPAGNRVLAQSPAGPQGGSQSQGGAPPAQQPPAAPVQKPQEGGATIAIEVPVVTLDVIATTTHGDLLTGLKKENFRVIDDGAPQTISNFGTSDARITIVMLMEFSSRGYYDWFAYQAKYWADAFFPNLQQKDWVALVTFDMKPRTEVDFTQNKNGVRGAFYHCSSPGSANRMSSTRAWIPRNA